ncbi:MAG TPA: energy transducer TonB [Myxococcota bacterium]|nr:energy transducer TonB [Myxococcota bacterium]
MWVVLIQLALAQDVTGGELHSEATDEVYGHLALKKRLYCHVRAEIDEAGRVFVAQAQDCVSGLEEASESLVRRSGYTPVRLDVEPTLAWLDVTVMWQGGHPRSWVNLVIPLAVEPLPPEVAVARTAELSRAEKARIGGAECIFSVLVSEDEGLEVLDVERCPEHLEELARLVMVTSTYEVEGQLAARLSVTFEFDNPVTLAFLPTRLPPELTPEQVELLRRPRMRDEPVGYPKLAYLRDIYGQCSLQVAVAPSGEVVDVVVGETCHSIFSRHARRTAYATTYFPLQYETPVSFGTGIDYCFPMVGIATAERVDCDPRAHTPGWVD